MRLYRALLRLYPASFRNEYGEEMCAIHAQRLRGSNPILVWMETIFEILYNAVRVHLDILAQDLRYAARTLGRTPGFTLTAIVVAALGIGATTAAFTMVDHVLIRPLPFPDPDRIVKLFEDHSYAGISTSDVSPANYRDWKSSATSFESMGAYRGLSVNLIGRGEPRQIDGSSFTSDVFPILGVKPFLGRLFTAEDDRETAPGTVILSYALWQNEFGGDVAVLGRKIMLDDVAYTVIGVMPETFYFPNRFSLLWTAMRFPAGVFEYRTNTYIYGIAKLKPGISVHKAAVEMRTIGAQLQRVYPKEMARISVTTRALRDDLPAAYRLALNILFGASLCVLLVACTNLANLLLARAMARRKELSVRAAMGAGTERLIRQMLTESLLLSATGGAVGILLAHSALPLLVRLVPNFLPIAEMPSIDWRVLTFAGVLTIATGIAFGVVPAIRTCRTSDGLREGSRSGVGGKKETLRSMLVVAEVAGSVVLLVCCGLLIRALWRIQAVDPGFRPENLLTLRTSLPMPKYQAPVRREQFYQQVLSRVRQLPGVNHAAYISFLPILMGGGVGPVEIEGRRQPVAERQNASRRFVTPGYFQTMEIPLLRGRDVAESDTLDRELVAAVSQSFVDKYWPRENPLGRRFTLDTTTRTVIGVVGNVRVRGPVDLSEPQVYLPYKQHKDLSTWYAPKDLAVRASGNAAALAPAIRRIIHEADPNQPVADVRPMTDIIDSLTGARRAQLAALGSFAAIAILLAAIGIHGVLSFAVSNRTQEIGVRLALGATRGGILRMILRDGLILAATGVVFGAALAYGAGIGMQSLLLGVNPGDLATFSVAIALCVAMTLAGSIIPALRAVRVDPTTAIRVE
jgi:predicted permease